jgi:C4-dicarboxylate transporter DctM subunit
MTSLICRIDKSLGSISGKINGFCGMISGLSILIIAIIVTYEIIMRFMFRSPTSWVLETSIYLCIASVFLAAGYTQKEKNHINVDLITLRLCRRDNMIIEFLTSLLAIIYVFVLTWEGGKLALNSLMSGDVSPTPLAVPMVIPWSFVPIGGILLLIELMANIFHLISNAVSGKTDHDEKASIEKASILPKGIFPILFLVLFTLSTWMLISKGLEAAGLVILLFLLLFSGMPVAFAMGLLGAMGFFFVFGGLPMLVQIPLVAYKVLDDFVLVAIPCFIMTSVVLMVGGVGPNLFEVASKWVRHLPGGLAVAAILSCALFAAISGSSTATVATIGVIALPEMISRGYPRSFSYGTLAIGGVLGPLIPPSIYMLVIGSITGDSVGKLFMAGMLPGIMLAALFSVYIICRSIKDKNIPKMTACPLKERLSATGEAFWGLMAPVIILGGIYTGIFTPTEAAAVGVTYSFIISFFIYRTISLKKFRAIILESAKLTAMILFIVAGSLIFGQVTVMMEVPQIVCNYLGGLPLPTMAILGMVLIFILFLGALMDELSILLITYPMLYYIFVQHFKFDSIWFALVFVFTLEVGLVAPPVGINLFVVQGIDKTARFEEVVKGVWPFVLLMIAAIFLVVYIKPLSLWLPGLLG